MIETETAVSMSSGPKIDKLAAQLYDPNRQQKYDRDPDTMDIDD